MQMVCADRNLSITVNILGWAILDVVLSTTPSFSVLLTRFISPWMWSVFNLYNMYESPKNMFIEKWLTHLHSFTLAFIYLQLIVIAVAVRFIIFSFLLLHTLYFPAMHFYFKKMKLASNIEVILRRDELEQKRILI